MSIRLKRLMRGIARSWQMNVGHLILVLAFFESQNAFLSRHMGKEIAADILVLFSFLLYVLRAKTNESLERKGMK